MLVDTHCHLDRYPHPDKVAREAERAGITIIAMTNLPSHFQVGRAPVAQMRNVRLSLGLHPMLAPHSDSELQLFSTLLSSTSWIGEIGLDFTKEGLKNEGAQRTSFEFVLRQVRGKGKILSIHSRRAESAVLEALLANGNRAAIFHWFTGEISSLQRIAESGYYFSINSAMFANEKGRSNIQSLPVSQVLLETDGPYNQIASKAVRPKDILLLVPQLASLWRMSPEDVVRTTSENFRRLVNLSQVDRDDSDQPLIAKDYNTPSVRR